MNYAQGATRPLPSTATPLDLDALFKPMSLDGIYARTGTYESVVSGLADFISTFREADMEILRFPPVMSRAHIERHGYLKSFPNLLGCVCGLHGSEQEIEQAAGRYYRGEDWTTSLAPNDLVLTPAACYPVYPIVAARGPVPDAGLRFDVAADCFRREPSRDIDRFQSFRMREYVCIGDPDYVSQFRERWMERAQGIARDLGLPFAIDYANDPFFGRVGQMKAVSQKQQQLKFELLVPLRSDEDKPTACMSFNYHRDHFGLAWGIRAADGSPAHTACVAFGMDRLAVAMFQIHGKNVDKWPVEVRDLLGLPRDDL